MEQPIRTPRKVWVVTEQYGSGDEAGFSVSVQTTHRRALAQAAGVRDAYHDQEWDAHPDVPDSWACDDAMVRIVEVVLDAQDQHCESPHWSEED